MHYKKPILIAEVGCNHKGKIDIAKKFINIASNFCGIRFIKFQKRDPKHFCLTKNIIPHIQFQKILMEILMVNIESF